MTQDDSWFASGRREPAPRPLYKSHSMTQLNEDILHYLLPYLSPETLDRAKSTNRVFFYAWMKYRYESLIFTKNDEKTKRLLAHLVDPNVAYYVKRVAIRPWPVNPPALTRRGLRVSLSEILDSHYIDHETERRLQKCLREDIALFVSAFNAMISIKEYCIDWDEGTVYRPELYKAFFIPILHKWGANLVKLTIKVPPQFLKSLASVRLANLEALEYHFCTGGMPPEDIDDLHDGFLVFVNNLKDSLESISFISTSTSVHLDITRIYKSLGLFPKLRSISLSAPFDGGHVSDPLIFVRFLEKHRSTLQNLSLLTSRCMTHLSPSDPECINWIQIILASIHTPFPQFRSLTLALRPLRAPLINVSIFLAMHASTLNSLTLADRPCDYPEFSSLMRTPNGPIDLRGLRHFRVKLDNFSPTILCYLASKLPRLTMLDIECISIGIRRGHATSDRAFFEAFSREIIANKHRLVRWKLQRLMTIGPQDWVHYIESALVECMPNLMILAIP